MEIWYQRLFMVVLLVLALIIVLYVIRSIVGPSLADRILSVNAIGTLTIVAIAVLTLSRRESYLMDVCLVYAMLSFLAIIVLTAFVTREHLELKELEEHPESYADETMLAMVQEHRERELLEKELQELSRTGERTGEMTYVPADTAPDPENAGFMEEWQNTKLDGSEAGLPEESVVEETAEEPGLQGLSAENVMKSSLVKEAQKYLKDRMKEEE